MRGATLRQLRAFTLVARHLSFAQAATALHLTPSAVSLQIKDLETTLGLSLFVRHGKAVTLTLVGGDKPREVTVVPVANEGRLRNLDWIDTNRRKVDQLSGGKLAYVYLPDTGGGGFTRSGGGGGGALGGVLSRSTDALMS